MSVTVTVHDEVLRAKLIALAPRMRTAMEETAKEIQADISELAVVDMIPPVGQSPRPRNSTNNLRMISGNLFRSYHEISNEHHVYKTAWHDWFLEIVVGSSQVSAKGFPYALYWEQHGRNHLMRAYKEFKETARKYSNELAQNFIRIWNEI